MHKTLFLRFSHSTTAMELRKLRTALMLSQPELSQITGIPASSISDAENGSSGSTAGTLRDLLRDPEMPLLSNLIRLAKFRRIVKALSAGNQTHFAEISGLSQGAVSIFLRGRRKITAERWETLLQNLGINEPETEPEDVAEAQIILAQNRDDEGFQLQSELEARGIVQKHFAEMLGVSPPALSQYFSSARFSKDLRKRVDKALAAL